MDIRQHRFIPNFSTASKVILDKKTKNKKRSKLKNEFRKLLQQF
jgi:hypothetical protein